MPASRMRFLLLSSCLLLLAGCSSVYKNLQPATGNFNHIYKFRPQFSVVLYNAEINVTSHHLSGLLLMKIMPDSSTRIVFSSEMGVKFFDFAFLKDGSFKVYYIIPQMNKGPVIKTLMKDFDLVLMRQQGSHEQYILKDSAHLYYVLPQQKGANYYITNMAGDSLLRMEKSSKRKPVAVATMMNYKNGLPDTIGIDHKNFKFTIGLKKIER
jgi:predicted RNA binding protein YcfA (HicA-like mRNA interferase family)